jgi:hypothetical protein
MSIESRKVYKVDHFLRWTEQLRSTPVRFGLLLEITQYTIMKLSVCERCNDTDQKSFSHRIDARTWKPEVRCRE